MGGFPEAASRIFNEEIVHSKRCEYKTKSDQVLNLLNEFVEVSDKLFKLFEQCSTDENAKVELFQKISEFEFWDTNMLKNMPISSCNGCQVLNMKYMLIPSHEILAFVEASENRFGDEALNLGQWTDKFNELAEKSIQFFDELTEASDKYDDLSEDYSSEDSISSEDTDSENSNSESSSSYF